MLYCERQHGFMALYMYTFQVYVGNSSQMCTIDFEWIGYSLDGHSNRTIYGNTTIPMPDIGRHSIQIFANDTLGINYESEIRYFSVSSSNPSIPSYNFPLILGIITIFSMISIRKKNRKCNF